MRTNALHEAFRAAGYVSAEERLKAILLRECAKPDDGSSIAPDRQQDEAARRQRLNAMVSNALKVENGKWDAAKDRFFAEVRRDPELLWELFRPWRAQAVQMLLTEAATELRALERAQRALSPSVPGHAQGGSHKAHARHANPMHSSGGRGHSKGDNHGQPAPSSRSRVAGVVAVVRQSWLDKLIINGQPVGDVTAAEAIKWAGRRERDARFVRLLTANLPLDTPIRRFRTPEETDALYEQAERETADAG